MKGVIRFIVMLFLSSFLLMYTLSWTTGQPTLPYSTVLIADAASVGIVLAIMFGIGILGALFNEEK